MNNFRIFESDDLSDDEILDNLLSILRKYIKNAGFEPYVSLEDNSIVIQFILDSSETMPSLMKVMNLLNKLHTDILIQYQCDFDLAETTDDRPLITAEFFYDESGSSKKGKKKPDDEEYFRDYSLPF
jgi:hypothetical protein